ncbi:hypothetical protein MUK42_37182 [Musa troglodytarum]|uniref:Uncharacterized protein n=1 Tax=Musa troglodytarum TaxID=320322 RepID=A0A9E7KK70_9LILI|nr:hypothetical protein MUK42_37182 [Musa troglodytarum]
MADTDGHLTVPSCPSTSMTPSIAGASRMTLVDIFRCRTPSISGLKRWLSACRLAGGLSACHRGRASRHGWALYRGKHEKDPVTRWRSSVVWIIRICARRVAAGGGNKVLKPLRRCLTNLHADGPMIGRRKNPSLLFDRSEPSELDDVMTS